MKGTGKTYLTREIINAVPDNVVAFDTIGALRKENLQVRKIYKIQNQKLELQALALSEITKKTRAKINVDLSELTHDEIIVFIDAYLRLTSLRAKYVFFDELAEYTPEQAKKSKEVERLIRHGRNEETTFVYNTQRPAHITKNVVDLTDVAIVFKIVWRRDLDVIRNLLNNVGVRDIETELRKIANLKTGQFRVYLL